MIARGKHIYDNSTDICKTIQLYVLMILMGIVISAVTTVVVVVLVKIISFLFYKLSTFTTRALFIGVLSYICYSGFRNKK